tara:strand:+ start:4977 stop:5759 length:783 start_codon:yes stop_codon:yes gene_type:complete
METIVNVFAENLFKDKSVLITGGGRGIGKEIALSFARLGADVAIASRNKENLEATKKEIKDMGQRCLALPTNIRDIEHVDSMVEHAIDGLGKIDFLINNAGGQFPAKPLDISDNGWRSVVDLNLNGTWNVTNRVGRHMVENEFGAIVNIVHIYSYNRGSPNFAHSGAARAGVVNLTKSLAYNWAKHNVTINSLAPGTIDTEALHEYNVPEFLDTKGIPAKRLGEQDEVAALCAFLCSPAARYINGTDIIMDGGNFIKSMW